jgi:predicted nuclease of restriction endonuclease-like (RecB) superfamily
MSEAMDFERLVDLCRIAHEVILNRAVRAVDLYLVIRNWLLGRCIVEYEQNGADRAAYGAGLMDALTARLKPLGIKGTSATRLRLYRAFYREYRAIQPTLSVISDPEGARIQPTASVESAPAMTDPGTLAEYVEKLSHCFTLGWSHYVTLLTIDSPDERRFYEIECAANHWSVRELERQIASSLYERLVLSRNKQGIRLLADQGQVIAKPSDLIKEPLVLEFLGLEERTPYSENDLECAIINKLEHFLLELGKDLGQMQMYVNYFDRHVKTADELPTIGIVLCHRKNDALVELTLPGEANIFASKYQLYLPSKEELKAKLEAIQAELEQCGVLRLDSGERVGSPAGCHQTRRSL